MSDKPIDAAEKNFAASDLTCAFLAADCHKIGPPKTRWHVLDTPEVVEIAPLPDQKPLTWPNFGGRGRYRTADRWCVNAATRRFSCSGASALCGYAQLRAFQALRSV